MLRDISRAVRTLAWTALFTFGCWGCLPSPTPKLVPMPPQEPTPTEWAVAVPERIAQADGVSVATIVKIDADWTYDDPCGFVAIIRKQCDGTVAYRLHLQPINKYVWTFTHPDGVFGLFEGEQALFVWRRIAAYRYQQCKEQQGMTSSYCPVDIIPALTSDLDVLPVADTARVAALRVKP